MVVRACGALDNLDQVGALGFDQGVLKYFVLYRSQAINISYSTSQAAWFFRITDKIFRTLPITGKKYFVLYLRWLGEGNFLVQILCGGSVIGHTTDPAPAPIASKEPEKGKRYFGL